MEVGIAYDLVSEVQLSPGEPEDLLDEYDPPEAIDALEAALQANGLTTRRLGGGEPLVRSVIDRRPDLFFNIAEGKGARSREAHVPAVLLAGKTGLEHEQLIGRIVDSCRSRYGI